ncbi:hypothetical protein HK096_001421, partial [Nowakowskiella sp. JEL0078]
EDTSNPILKANQVNIVRERVKHLFDLKYKSQSILTANKPVDTIKTNSLQSRLAKKRKITSLSDQLADYFNIPPSDHDIDPLLWWKDHAISFPDVARMACDYLAIPATSTASEREFSGGKQLISENRHNLGPG